MDEEAKQQEITYLLQEIDANICAAHRSATEISKSLRRHHQILKKIHESTQIWQPLFKALQNDTGVNNTEDDEEIRTPERGRFRPLRSTTLSARRNDDTPINYKLYKEMDTKDYEEYPENNLASPEDFTLREEMTPSFRTATLAEYDGSKRRASAESSSQSEVSSAMHTPFNAPTRQYQYTETAASYSSVATSINSQNLPEIRTKPLISTNNTNQKDSNTDISIETQVSFHEKEASWSATQVASPSTKSLLASNDRTIPRTPNSHKSDVSSVKYDSPGTARVSKNLLESGAYNFSPTGSERGYSRNASPSTASKQYIRSKVQSPQASSRKRSRSESKDSPSQQSRTNLRQKFHVEKEFLTPTKQRRKAVQINRSPAKVAGILPTLSDEENEIEEASSPPSFEMTSPLLSTGLRIMTPHTPISNRIVGATLQVGSIDQESKLNDYEDSFQAGDPAPEFTLSLFPAVFQRGTGAIQLSTLYSKFHTNGKNRALSVVQLQELLPDYGKPSIEMLLDILVSKGFLRPFVIQGTMFWQSREKTKETNNSR